MPAWKKAPQPVPASSPSGHSVTTHRPPGQGRPRPGSPAPGDYGDDVTEHSGVLWCIYCSFLFIQQLLPWPPSPHTPALLAAGRLVIPLQDTGSGLH